MPLSRGITEFYAAAQVGVTFGFFLITSSMLFLRASLSLLKRFYFQVQSIILASKVCLFMHLSNKVTQYLQSGSCSNLRLRQYSIYSLNSTGYPLQSSSRDVSNFFFLIFLYFSSLFLPGKFYQGREPRKKYNMTWPMVSRSSRLDYSFPMCVASEAYLAVPVRFLPSIKGMCQPSEFLQHLASPKSMI